MVDPPEINWSLQGRDGMQVIWEPVLPHLQIRNVAFLGQEYNVP